MPARRKDGTDSADVLNDLYCCCFMPWKGDHDDASSITIHGWGGNDCITVHSGSHTIVGG